MKKFLPCYHLIHTQLYNTPYTSPPSVPLPPLPPLYTPPYPCHIWGMMFQTKFLGEFFDFTKGHPFFKKNFWENFDHIFKTSLYMLKRFRTFATWTG